MPLCAEMCSTKALLAGDANVLSEIYRKRIVNRAGRTLQRGVSFQNATLRSPRGLQGKASTIE